MCVVLPCMHRWHAHLLFVHVFRFVTSCTPCSPCPVSLPFLPCCPAPPPLLLLLLLQLDSQKHGWGSHYTGYGSNVHVNEKGALGITSAHASEDSIELMVRGVGVGWLGWCGALYYCKLQTVEGQCLPAEV